MDAAMMRFFVLAPRRGPALAATLVFLFAAGVAGLAPASATGPDGAVSGKGGVATGCGWPRWQVQQLTATSPPKLDLLMVRVISSIRRAVFFAGLSSLSHSQPRSPRTWQ